MDINELVNRLSPAAAQEVRAVVAEMANEALRTEIAELQAKATKAKEPKAKQTAK